LLFVEASAGPRTPQALPIDGASRHRSDGGSFLLVLEEEGAGDPLVLAVPSIELAMPGDASGPVEGPWAAPKDNPISAEANLAALAASTQTGARPTRILGAALPGLAQENGATPAQASSGANPSPSRNLPHGAYAGADLPARLTSEADGSPDDLQALPREGEGLPGSLAPQSADPERRHRWPADGAPAVTAGGETVPPETSETDASAAKPKDELAWPELSRLAIPLPEDGRVTDPAPGPGLSGRDPEMSEAAAAGNAQPGPDGETQRQTTKMTQVTATTHQAGDQLTQTASFEKDPGSAQQTAGRNDGDLDSPLPMEVPDPAFSRGPREDADPLPGRTTTDAGAIAESAGQRPEPRITDAHSRGYLVDGGAAGDLVAQGTLRPGFGESLAHPPGTFRKTDADRLGEEIIVPVRSAEDDDRTGQQLAAEKPSPAAGIEPRSPGVPLTPASMVRIPETSAAMMEHETALPIPPGDLHPGQKSLEPTSSGAVPATQAESGRSVGTQLVTAVLANQEGAFEVHLSPEELGRVKLSLHVVDGSIALAIQAERSETLDLLRRHIDLLEREFRDAGFTSMSFSFGQGSANGRMPRSAAHEDALGEPSSRQNSVIAPLASPASAQPSSRLDLRL